MEKIKESVKDQGRRRKLYCVFCCNKIFESDEGSAEVGHDCDRIYRTISNILDIKREKCVATTERNGTVPLKIKMCMRCYKIGSDIYPLNLQIKAAELKLNGKLDELNKIAGAAAQLSKKRTGEGKEQKNFRNAFIAKCSARILNSFPQLKLHRVDQNASKRKRKSSKNLDTVTTSKFRCIDDNSNDGEVEKPDRPIIVMTDFIEVSEDEAEMFAITPEQLPTLQVVLGNCGESHIHSNGTIVDTVGNKPAEPNVISLNLNDGKLDSSLEISYQLPQTDNNKQGENLATGLVCSDSSQQEKTDETKSKSRQVSIRKFLSVTLKQTKYSCSKCPVTVFTSTELERHLEEAHNKTGSGGDTNTASEGKEDYPNALSDTANHFQSCHDDTSSTESANKGISNSDKLRNDSGQKQKVIAAAKAAMESQMRNLELEDRPIRRKRTQHSCSQCPKTFSTSTGLVRHVEEVHSRNDPCGDNDSGSESNEQNTISDSEDCSLSSQDSNSSSSESDYFDDGIPTVDELRDDDEGEAKAEPLPQPRAKSNRPALRTREELLVRPRPNRTKHHCVQCPIAFFTSAGLDRHVEETHNRVHSNRDVGTGECEPNTLSDTDSCSAGCQDDPSSGSDYFDDDGSNVDESRDDGDGEAKAKPLQYHLLEKPYSYGQSSRKRNRNSHKPMYIRGLLDRIGPRVRNFKYLRPEMEAYCEVCKKDFGSRLALEKHRVVVHKFTHFVHCPACGNYYNSRYEVQRHMQKSCKLAEKLKAKQPLQEAAVYEPLIRYPYATRQRGRYFCTKEGCHEVFLKKTLVTIHLRTHGNWTCSAATCTETFTKAHELAMHEAKCHIFEPSTSGRAANIQYLTKESPDFEFSCFRCKYSSPTVTRYLTHFVGKHLGFDYEEGIKCPICSQAFPNCQKHMLMKHIRTQHKDGASHGDKFKCKLCKVTFQDWDPFYRHLQLTHKIKDSFECAHCDKKFRKIYQLRRHVKRVHKYLTSNVPEDFKYECTVCKERFMREVNLQCHQAVHENRDNWLPCNICRRKFEKKIDLDRHRKLHTGTKQTHSPHICEHCGKSFVDKTKLTQHMFVHENPEKWKHVCTEEGCGKRFFYKTKLTEHLRTHTNEKPFVCDTCGKKYSHRHNLRIHVKNHHGENAAAALVVKNYGRPFHESSQDPGNSDK